MTRRAPRLGLAFAALAIGVLWGCTDPAFRDAGPPDTGPRDASSADAELDDDSGLVDSGNEPDGDAGADAFAGLDAASDAGRCVGNADCAHRPCETATCDRGACVYAARVCPGASAACDEPMLDSEDFLVCGTRTDACSLRPVCDTEATDEAMECTAFDNVRCGECRLGLALCEDVSEAPRCVAPALDPGTSCGGGDAILYVDPTSGAASPDGTRARPFLTVTAALDEARRRASMMLTPATRLVVIAGSSTFDGPFELVDGVSVWGGFRSGSFEPTEGERPTLRALPPGTDGIALVVVSAREIDMPTTLAHVSVRTDPLIGTGAPGLSVVGVHAVRSPGLRIDDVIVDLGRAQDGAVGATGTAPPNVGATGNVGANGRSMTGLASGVVCRSALGAPVATPAAGTACLGRTGTTTGGEGAGNQPPTSGISYMRGMDAPTGAAGGLASFGTGPILGPGTAGLAHSAPASSGSPGTPTLTISSDLPSPTGSGAPGSDGVNGRGGGGGGSGAASFFGAGPTICAVGGAGGSGGAGGCGGGGGGGGAPGGWVHGLVIVGDPIQLSRVSMTLGAGGAGGTGGPGVAGSAGGSGGPGGGPPSTLGTANPIAYSGSAGGAGGPGQSGGDGGPGAAGSSVGTFCIGPLSAGLVLTGVTAAGAAETSRGCM